MTVTLESPDPQPVLHLREGASKAGAELASDDGESATGYKLAKIVESLQPGTYTIEARTFSEKHEGPFTLTVSLAEAATPPVSGCDITEIATDGTPVPGAWSNDCISQSQHQAGHYARYYQFTLEDTADVTVLLESDAAETVLYLREGVGVISGETVTGGFNDGDPKNYHRAEITAENLAAGTYTIEATTYRANKTGAFKLTVSVTGGGGSVATGRAALVAFYDATDGPNWTNNDGWLTDAPIGDWYGIQTDSNGRVVVIDLQENLLSGAVPRELGDLTSLQQLMLGNVEVECSEGSGCVPTSPTANRLSGAIPPELGQLTNLESFHLALNRLSGEIPPELGNLTSLETLWLYSNQLTGEIRPWLGNLASLKSLSLHSNQLSGSIPAELGDLTSLEELGLSTNQLSGSIPVELGSLTSLEFLYLRENQLSGSIPVELGSLTNLQGLLLSDNQLSGQIPYELGNLAKLQHLWLSNNQLSGCIPAALRAVPDNDLIFPGMPPFCDS